MSIPEVLRAMRRSHDGYSATIPDQWLQGRTSYGGLSSALALEAARNLADDLPPLRSANIAFVGPLSGDVRVSAEIIRRGKNASWARAEVTSDLGIGLLATYVFMNAMESHIHLNDFPAPLVPRPEEAPGGGDVRQGPTFLPNFDWRYAVPRTDPPSPELSRWMRLKDRDGLDPMVEVLSVGDGLPPGVLPLLGRSVPLSSMTWIVNMLTPEPKTRDGWWLLRSWANYAENGCSSQSMGIWNSEGEPVASGMQSIALFG